MNLVEQAKLSVNEQRNFLIDKHYNDILNNIPKNINSKKEEWKYVMSYVDNHIFYSLPLTTPCRLTKIRSF